MSLQAVNNYLGCNTNFRVHSPSCPNILQWQIRDLMLQYILLRMCQRSLCRQNMKSYQILHENKLVKKQKEPDHLLKFHVIKAKDVYLYSKDRLQKDFRCQAPLNILR